MVILRTLTFAALLFPIGSVAAVPKAADTRKEADSTFEVLQARRMPFEWKRDSMLRIDINCDGKPDYAFMGKTADSVAVAVISGPASSPTQIDVLRFAIDPTTQDGVCSAKTRFAPESLNYNPADIGTLPGFRRSQCVSFRVDSDNCDALHFYWDHDAHRLSWWRR